VNAVWFRFRAELRTRWRAWLGLGLLVGVAGGVVIALVAGARRTDSAYSRLRDAQRPFDSIVFDGGFLGNLPVPPNFLDRVAGLPEVAESGRFMTLADNGGVTSQGQRIGEPDFVQTIVPTDDAAVELLSRQKLLEGRHPDPSAVDEAAINFTVADRYDLDVGDGFELELLTDSLARAFDLPDTLEPGEMRAFRVVGVFASAGDFPPRTLGDGAGFVDFTPAFAAASPEFAAQKAMAVRLANSRDDVLAFQRGVERVIGNPDIRFDDVGTFSVALQHSSTERAIDVLAVALWVLAALAVAAAALIVGQSLARMAAIESFENPRLHALGFTRVQLVGLGVVRGAVPALGGALIAIVIAFGLSPLFPLGLARTAEPDPGVRFDGVAMLGGAAVLVLTVSLLAAVAGWRASRLGREADAPVAGAPVSRIGNALARAGLPSTAVTGVRMALETGRGATAVPVRTTLVGAAIGVAAVAGALTFGAALDHLFENPRLYGWNWDVTVGDGYGPDAYEDVVPALAEERTIEAMGAATFGAVEVEGREVFVLATDDVKGSIGPTVIEGRAPTAPDEILLGTETLDQTDASIGDSVAVRFVGTFQGEASGDVPKRDLRVVGRGVLPEQSDIGLDDAGAVTYEGLRALGPGEDLPRNFFPVEFAAGVDPDDGLADLSDDVGLYTVPLQRPTDTVNFGRVDAFPLLGAGLFTLTAVAMLTHLLLSSVRRRRRDLALLKTLGFTRRQVSYAVAWQAATLAAAALLIGLPLGIAAGRWAWSITATQLGVAAEPAVPPLALSLVVPIAIGLAILIASVPAWFAARARAAVLLRAE
jgi:FtsX-like permease family/MacB-like periplasmic core domain